MESNGHPVAGEGRDHAGLIAEPEQALRFGWRRRVNEAIGDLKDRQGAFENRDGIMEAILQKRRFPANVVEQTAPAPADRLEAMARYHKAQVGDPSFDHLQPGIAPRKEKDLNRTLKGALLPLVQNVVSLEADQVLRRSRGGPLGSPDIMLSGREEQRSGVDLPELPRIRSDAGFIG
jgi:hypothetical protein